MRFAKVLCIICLFGCGLEDVTESDPRVQAAVEEKIAQKTKELRSTCIEEVLIKAEIAVDSTLRAQALQEKLSIFNPPIKPDKPSPPVIPIIEDSLDISPLNKSILNPNVLQKDTLRKN